jgi:hypothetical protein
VTKIIVVPSRSCSRFSSTRISSRSSVEIGEARRAAARGFGDERAGERHALLLAAGQLPRVPGAERAETDQVQHALDARAQLGRRHRAPAKAEGDVLEHGHVREERVRLEDQPEVAAMDGHPRDVLARQHDLPAVGLDEAGDHPEERALAAARGAEKREELAGGGVERHVVDRDHRAERLAEPAHGERRRGAAHRR